MGYTTEFEGSFEFNKPVTEYLRNYINKFSSIRHMRRNVNEIKRFDSNWKDRSFCDELGVDGAYYIDEPRNWWDNPTIIDYNRPACGVPELYCQWIIDDNDKLVWDGGEKFYAYMKWLEYLIEHFFEPLGYVLNGSVEFQGEDPDDRGIIEIKNNVVNRQYYSEESNTDSVA